MSVKKLGDIFNDENIKHTNDMATVVSTGVNGWSAKLYAEIDGDVGEAVRSTVLGISDIISLAKESVFVKNISKNQANSIVQSLILGERFLENMVSSIREADSNNGFVKSARIIDLFADGAAIFSNIVDFFKISPMGILLNASSIILTTISNSMKELELEPEIHVNEIAQIMQMAIKVSMGPVGIALEAITELAETLTPEEYKFWSDEAIELMGTDGNDTFETLSTYFHDRPRIIFANAGNDVLTGDDGKDTLHGGSGNDVFYGDEGADLLIDTEGFDTYHIADNDTIYDSDAKGRIFIDDKQLPKVFTKPDSSSEIAPMWQAKDSNDNITHNAHRTGDDLTIFVVGETDSIVIKDFFKLSTNTPTETGTIYSALSLSLANESDKDEAESLSPYYLQVQNPNLSTVIYAGAHNTPLHIVGGESRYGDIVFGTGLKHSLTVEAGDGVDAIYGGTAGDTIKGGLGSDILFGSSPAYDNPDIANTTAPANLPDTDQDTIYGGEGSDLIHGGVGKDTLYADDKDSHLITKGSTAKGDWILGGSGNDTLYGSSARDLLQGGKDSDTIYGGGGDDVILGDAQIRFGNKSQHIQGDSGNISWNYGTVGGGIHPLVGGTMVGTPTYTVPKNLSKSTHRQI